MKIKKNTALVLSGGGARGAYEAGVLLYLRDALPTRLRQIHFPILSGTSVGAINISYWASQAHQPLKQGVNLANLWKNLKSSSVYKLALTETLKSLIQGHSHALLDTSPLKNFINTHMNWAQIKNNLQAGLFKSLILVGTHMRSGEVELFIQSKSKLPTQLPFNAKQVDLETSHIMASAAIPLIFPSIIIHKKFYVDGGVRINTPLAPSIHMGAKKLFIVALHSNQADASQKKESEIENPPSLGEHLGKVLNLFFLDKLKHDLEQLELINKLIIKSENAYGKNYLTKINSQSVTHKHFAKIKTLVIKPSIPISSIYQQWYLERSAFDMKSLFENVLLKILDLNPALSTDLLSYLTFEKAYLSALIDLGYQDAKLQREAIIDFFSQN